MLPLIAATLSAALLAPAVAPLPAVAAAGPPAVDYARTASCAYNSAAPGWASVARAPKGTTYIVFTMRTGTPGDWDASDVTSTSKARQWRVETGVGMSFINWVTFYSDEGWVDSHMVNLRCEETPDDWPS